MPRWASGRPDYSSDVMIVVLLTFCALSRLRMFGPRHIETQSLISFYWYQPYTPPEVPGRLTQNKWEGVNTKPTIHPFRFLSLVWSMGVFIIQNMEMSLSVPSHSPLSVATLRSVSYETWHPDTMYLVDCQNNFLLVRKFPGTKRCVSEHSICNRSSCDLEWEFLKYALFRSKYKQWKSEPRLENVSGNYV